MSLRQMGAGPGTHPPRWPGVSPPRLPPGETPRGSSESLGPSSRQVGAQRKEGEVLNGGERWGEMRAPGQGSSTCKGTEGWPGPREPQGPAGDSD